MRIECLLSYGTRGQSFSQKIKVVLIGFLNFLLLPLSDSVPHVTLEAEAKRDDRITDAENKATEMTISDDWRHLSKTNEPVSCKRSTEIQVKGKISQVDVSFEFFESDGRLHIDKDQPQS